MFLPIKEEVTCPWAESSAGTCSCLAVCLCHTILFVVQPCVSKRRSVLPFPIRYRDVWTSTITRAKYLVVTVYPMQLRAQFGGSVDKGAKEREAMCHGKRKGKQTYDGVDM